MSGLEITILTPDTSQAQHAARRLRTLLKEVGVLACVQEVTCYLEISRRGLTETTPAIAVNDTVYKCKNLEPPLLARFVCWLAEGQAHNDNSHSN